MRWHSNLLLQTYRCLEDVSLMDNHKHKQRDSRKILRIPEKRAAAVLDEFERSLNELRGLLDELWNVGIATLLAALKDDVIYLALQPDSWGERTKARLISEIAPALQPAASGLGNINAQYITECVNILATCLLLELGRRQHLINIEFPADPMRPSSRFRIRVSPAFPFHTVGNRDLIDLVSKRGSDLVGVCYFGDPECRNRVEHHLESISKVKELKRR